jgi:hypothetical protein
VLRVPARVRVPEQAQESVRERVPVPVLAQVRALEPVRVQRLELVRLREPEQERAPWLPYCRSRKSRCPMSLQLLSVPA